MPLFSLLAVLLSLIVLAGVLWPLWPQARRLFIAALLTLSIGTLALYHVLGTPAALDPPPAAALAAPASLQQAVTELEAELKRNPGQAEGWRLLGRSYLRLERYTDARTAFETALKLTPDDADVLVENAQARLYADPQKRLDATAVALLERALALQPQHQRARWFLGVAHRQQGRPAEAARTWEPLLTQTDAATAAPLREQINLARTEAGLPTLPPDTATGKPLLRLRVDIAPALKARLSETATVFVFARQSDGSSMPVAAKRLPAHRLPITVELSDDDSPMPTQKLSQVSQVQLGARLSNSGQATAQPGDVQATPITAQVGSTDTYPLQLEHVVE